MPADIPQNNINCIENVRFFDYNNLIKQSAFAFMLNENYFLREFLETQRDIIDFENDKLINLESHIIKQYDKLYEYYNSIDIDFFKSEHLKVSADILSYNPDVISTQLTSDKSIFATFTKDDLVYHLDYYLEKSDDDDDVVLAVTNNNNITKSFSGSYDFVMDKLEKIIPSSNIALELELNELSN